MTTNPKPLTKNQRARAERAQALHHELVQLTAQADAARWKRDANVVALLREGVRPFVVENETGIPASVLNRLVRVAKAAQ